MRFVLMIFIGFFAFVGITSCNNEEPINNEAVILGTWELKQYVNKTTGLVVEAPKDADPIVIEFKSENFVGNTERNSFFGNYKTVSDALYLKEFASTEVVETEWGKKFMDAMVSTYNKENNKFEMLFYIEDNILKIAYKPTEFIYFEKS